MINNDNLQTYKRMFSEEHATPKSDSVDVIKLKNITHIFNEGQPNEYKLFENFNLTIPDIPNRGQLVSIMGASGCGKSQMLKVIAGLNKFQKGTVEIYGKEIGDNHSFPMVFQTYSNYEWYTVLENVMIPMLIRNVDKATAEQKALALLEEVGLKEHAYKYPAKLSGGQQQRVAIARCLACNSQIILLDEATGALDIKMKREVQNIILKIFYEMKTDPTIINVSHSVEEVCYISNKVIILEANPCRIFKEIDIHYTGEETRQRGEWLFETQEYANYVRMITNYMDEICK
ncbi:MAG: ATP-binding cassette domain-containing protein [Paludibacteraceae bacterium]|nr:ATP-binding cassette domain-containing protein [Paludibacteraceae bacterium]MEE1083699.1 ATP-binding cassette domain-containing protein [Paludibacteraceae bacterium]